jgi:hypothetical protein
MKRSAILGIVIDVSSSMRQSWKNTNGRELPKVEVVHDALVERLRFFGSQKIIGGRDYSKVHVFCLGAGFVRPVFINEVNVSHLQEKIFDETMEKRTQHDIVCDILALADIVPKQRDIDRIKTALNTRWNDYARTTLEGIQIPNDVYDILASFVRESLERTGRAKLQKSVRYKLYRSLSSQRQSRILGQVCSRLEQSIIKRTHLIETVSQQESIRHVDRVSKKCREILEAKHEDFAQYIAEKLNHFLSDQSIILLDLLTIGGDVPSVLEHFHETVFRTLINEIYEHLKADVEHEIGRFWQVTAQLPRIDQARVGASLNPRAFKQHIEQCMKRDIWSELKPYVEQVVYNLFSSVFAAQVRERIPYWIGLASTREVVKPVTKIFGLFPQSSDISLYSDEFMFGVTPIKDALDRAAVRLLDDAHQRKDKTLVLLSDGEFENINPLFDPVRVADVLKKSGVRVVSLYVGKRDLVAKKGKNTRKRGLSGAQILHDMASVFNPEGLLEQDLIRRGLSISVDTNLFFHINNSQLLTDMLDVIFADGYPINTFLQEEAV